MRLTKSSFSSDSGRWTLFVVGTYCQCSFQNFPWGGAVSSSFWMGTSVDSTRWFLSFHLVFEHISSWKAANLTSASLTVVGFTRSQALWYSLVPKNICHFPVGARLLPLFTSQMRYTAMNQWCEHLHVVNVFSSSLLIADMFMIHVSYFIAYS